MSITVVIPFQTKNQFLIKAINSCLDQNSVDEILLIQDNHIPLFTEIELLSINSKRVKIIRNNFQEGAYGARIYGLTLASNDLVAFLDSDDVLFKNSLSYLMSEMLKDESIGLAYGITLSNETPIDILKISGFIYPQVLKNLSLSPFSGLLVRKNILNAIKPNLKLPAFQDDDFILNISQNFKIIFVNHEIAKMNTDHDDRLSKKFDNLTSGLSMLLEIWGRQIQEYYGRKYIYLWRLRLLNIRLSKYAIVSSDILIIGGAMSWLFKSLFFINRNLFKLFFDKIHV